MLIILVLAMKVADERKSSVLASNAIHHRVDSLTALVALFTIGGTHLFQNAFWLDPVGGLLISMMVVRAGWGNTKTSLLELADAAIDDDVKSSTREAVSKVLAQTEGSDSIRVRDIQGMKSGQNYLLDIELAVPGSWSVNRSREIEEAVRDAVGDHVLGAKRVRVRFVPLEQGDLKFSEEFISVDHHAHQHSELEDSSRKRR